MTDVAVPDAIAWLLALRALERLDRPTRVRVTGHVESSGGWDAATRRVVATAAEEGAVAVVDGVPVHERLAERRWLAWFPRPVGPRHAVNVGGPTVGRLADVPGLDLVRVHLSVASWRAELLQAMANLAGSRLADGMLRRWVARGEDVDDADVRWACVVEVTEDDDALVRAWAHGWAPAATGRAVVEALAGEGGGPAGAARMDGARARALLDGLAADTGLRWSLRGPDGR